MFARSIRSNGEKEIRMLWFAKSLLVDRRGKSFWDATPASNDLPYNEYFRQEVHDNHVMLIPGIAVYKLGFIFRG